MVRWIGVTLLVSAFAQAQKPEAGPTEVIVLRALPPAAFRWVGTGNGGVPCRAEQCEHYYNRIEPGFPSADVIVRLQMPDKRIAVVECDAKEVPGVNYAIQAMNGADADVPIRRTCATPPEGMATEAAFNGNSVRLTVPGARKNGDPKTEMYHIKGFLEPMPENNPATGTQAFISTVPFGAQVFLDGERVGTTPVQVTIPATGKPHVFTIRKDGFVPIRQYLGADSERTRFDYLMKAAN